VKVESFVIDSNVVVAVERADAGLTCEVSDEPREVIDHIVESGSRVLIDVGGHIEQEWRNGVNTDWFENWFLTLATNANLAQIDAVRDQALERKLRVDHGLPRSENIWLVRTAVAEVAINGDCNLLTEDMDFRDPTKKKAAPATRRRYLEGTTIGPVAKTLRGAGVEVLALCSY
jgi:hypothetical protein